MFAFELEIVEKPIVANFYTNDCKIDCQKETLKTIFECWMNSLQNSLHSLMGYRLCGDNFLRSSKFFSIWLASLWMIPLGQAETPVKKKSLDEVLALTEDDTHRNGIIESGYIEAEAMVEEARSGLLPRVSFVFDLARGSSSQGTLPGIQSKGQQYYNRSKIGLNLEQPVFGFGRLSDQFRMVRKQSQINREQKNMSFQGYQLEVINLYCNALVNQIQLDLARKHLSYVESLKVINDIDRQVGASSLVNSKRAGAELASAKAKLAQADIAASAASERLVFLLQGNYVLPPFVLSTENLDDNKFFSWVAPELDSQSFNLTLKRLELDMNRLELRYRKESYFPIVSFFASVGSTIRKISDDESLSFDIQDLFRDEDAGYFEFGIRLQWVVFDGLYTRALIHKAGAKIDRTFSQLGELRDNEKVLKIEAVRSLKTANEMLAAAKESVTAMAIVLEIMERDYQQGVIGLRELLEIKKQHQAAFLEVYQAYVQKIQAIAKAKNAFGEPIYRS